MQKADGPPCGSASPSPVAPAARHLPDVAFRHAVVLALAGDATSARHRLESCYRLHDGWREIVARLPAAGLLPDDPALVARLLADRP